MRYFVNVYGSSSHVLDPSGLDFATEEQALKDILSNLFEVVDELQEDCEAPAFERVEITDELGNIVRSVSVSDLLRSSGNS